MLDEVLIQQRISDGEKLVVCAQFPVTDRQSGNEADRAFTALASLSQRLKRLNGKHGLQYNHIEKDGLIRLSVRMDSIPKYYFGEVIEILSPLQLAFTIEKAS